MSQISGGQLKRAGLGAELLADPSLLFLDEVTSGLDEQSDGEVMRLFRSLADSGKSLICVTHNLAHVEENCHLVAVLTVGGKLAFFGSPAEAKSYFEIERLADIYTKLPLQSPESWHATFRDSSCFSKYVAKRRPKISTFADQGGATNGERGRTHSLKQFNVLLRRTIAVWSGNRVALGVFFGQALLVAMLLCLVFGRLEEAVTQNPPERAGMIRNLLFLLSVSCIWLGCNNGVKEIVKERSIYLRERSFGLIPEAYLVSKFVFLIAIGLSQSQLLGLIVLMWFGMPGSTPGMLAILATGSLAGTALGLAISAHARTEETAVALVPIVIIPQIILAGVVAMLPVFCEWIARMSITAYWSQHAIEGCLPEADQMPADFEPAMSVSVGMTLVHALIFSFIAWLGVRRHKQG
jgi:energy-coupling factor transporter ATP-binding protein EcfA2